MWLLLAHLAAESEVEVLSVGSLRQRGAVSQVKIGLPAGCIHTNSWLGRHFPNISSVACLALFRVGTYRLMLMWVGAIWVSRLHAGQQGRPKQVQAVSGTSVSMQWWLSPHLTDP